MTTVRFHRAMTPPARAYLCAQLGWRVMPLRPHTKSPALKDWPKLATTDWGQIQEWWFARFAGYEVGVMTGPESGIWVLDIDVKWCNGFESVRDLFARHGVTEVPNTFRVASPSTGQQWYFTYPTDGRKIKNVSSAENVPGPLGPGLDVRGWHGQVVAPEGVGRQVLNDTLPIAAPDWLVELVTAKPHEAVNLPPVENTLHALQIAGRVADRLASITQGGRNHALNKAAFTLGTIAAQGVLNEHEAQAALLNACMMNGLINDDGPEGFTATFNSGWNAGLAAGGTKS